MQNWRFRLRTTDSNHGEKIYLNEYGTFNDALAIIDRFIEENAFVHQLVINRR